MTDYTSTVTLGTKRPTDDDRLRADAVGWIEDTQSLLARGAVCTCIPDHFRCWLCEKLDLALEAIRAHSGVSL